MGPVRLPPCQRLATEVAGANPRHAWLLRGVATNDTFFDKEIRKQKTKKFVAETVALVASPPSHIKPLMGYCE
jgi:hypothetical protein